MSTLYPMKAIGCSREEAIMFCVQMNRITQLGLNDNFEEWTDRGIVHLYQYFRNVKERMTRV
ncbi:gp157 [Bacillus phage W.Ph.]|uniref:Gp157 n=1 Tax=Bacillus phage W.Ph. TaxID=764595 RepID=G9B1Q8_9CAUD|nr:gp157 [Bacillus phage W.Ph.]ADH03303.1 gp157 [Bacillus phage W.Ph.]